MAAGRTRPLHQSLHHTGSAFSCTVSPLIGDITVGFAKVRALQIRCALLAGRTGPLETSSSRNCTASVRDRWASVVALPRHGTQRRAACAVTPYSRMPMRTHHTLAPPACVNAYTSTVRRHEAKTQAGGNAAAKATPPPVASKTPTITTTTSKIAGRTNGHREDVAACCFQGRYGRRKGRPPVASRRGHATKT